MATFPPENPSPSGAYQPDHAGSQQPPGYTAPPGYAPPGFTSPQPTGYPPTGYVPTGYVAGYAPVGIAPVQANSGWATASFVFGILGLCTGFGAIPAIICGHIALRMINNAAGHLKGKGLAMAGLVMGYLVVAAAVVGMIAAGISSLNR